MKSVYGIWAGPRDGRVLGAGAHAGIPQLIEVDRETGQPKGNWRGRVGECWCDGDGDSGGGNHGG